MDRMDPCESIGILSPETQPPDANKSPQRSGFSNHRSALNPKLFTSGLGVLGARLFGLNSSDVSTTPNPEP